MSLNKLFQYKKGYPIVIVCFIMIYILNFPLEFFVGGDAIANFLNPQFYYDIFVWNASSVIGGVGNKTIYIGYMFYAYVLEILVNSFGILWGQYIYNLIFFLFCNIMFYYGIEYHFKQKKHAVLLTLFFTLSIVGWWVIAHRGLLFISLVFFSGPAIARMLISSIKYKRYYIYLMIAGVILLPIMTNPGYFIPWSIFGIAFVFYYINFVELNKQIVKKILTGMLFFLVPFTSIFCSYFIFLNYNNAITQDKWNTEVLLKNTLAKEAKTNNLSNILRTYQPFVNSYWGYMDSSNDEKKHYYMFSGKDNYFNFLYTTFSWLPLFLLTLGLIYIKDSHFRKQYFYWFGVFLFTIFWMKSSAPPLGGIYTWLMNNVSLFGIFRSPHLKFSPLLMLSIVFLLIIFFSYLEKYKKQKELNIVTIGLLVYTLLFGYYWITGNAIPKIKLIKTIPNEYIEASSFLRASDTQKAIIAPFNKSTWTNTDFGYEGYSLFMALLPDIGIWNKNDGAFSKYSKNIEQEVGKTLLYNKGNLLEQLSKFNIDTIIYDGYTNRYQRFKYKEKHKENIVFLKNSGLKKVGTFGKITIWKTPSELLVGNLYSKHGSLKHITKINPIRYDLKFENLTTDQLIFLQSFHEQWMIFPKINTGKKTIGNLWLYDIMYLFEKNIFSKSHDIFNGYANSWNISNEKVPPEYKAMNLDGSSNLELTMYFRPQLYFYLGVIASILLAFGLNIVLGVIYFKKRFSGKK